MNFIVIPRGAQPPNGSRDIAFLVQDRWDDWGKYRTQFDLIVFDAAGVRHDPGETKIGQRGLLPSGTVEPGKRAPDVPGQFEQLGESFFSVGQGDTYYEVIGRLPSDIRTAILTGLRDCAFSLDILDDIAGEEVFEESLLRSVSRSSVRNRFHRLAHGNAILTRYTFDYELPSELTPAPPRVSFDVQPLSQPPTNIHVLIGRNGVGKTRLLQALAGAIVSEAERPREYGRLLSESFGSEWSFAGLVTVTFSVFDTFVMPTVTRQGMTSSLIGIRHPAQAGGTTTGANQHNLQASVRANDVIDKASFAAAFVKSLGQCRQGPRRERFHDAVIALENDPLFAEVEVTSLLDLSEDEWADAANALFQLLSSGHAIVLLTVTRLVELVDEGTIVLLDEPEVHLHPPLLSAFIRSLSDLLVKRNGLAVVSTHSPVVLQEVPRSCVWMLRRAGAQSVAERPSIETFGENVGILTREVFGLEVTQSGFHSLLQKEVGQGNDFESIVARFNGQLGAEAQAILRSLVALRDSTPGAR
jgi:predicted ATPase